MRLPRGLLIELAAQALLLGLALGLVLAFGFPDQQHAPRELALFILAIVMAVPAGYGGFLIVRALRPRRGARSGRA